MLAGLGFPHLQQAREIQRLQQGNGQQQRQQFLPNQQGAPAGLRVEIGFGGPNGQQQFVFPGAVQQQAGQSAQATVGQIPVFGGTPVNVSAF